MQREKSEAVWKLTEAVREWLRELGSAPPKEPKLNTVPDTQLYSGVRGNRVLNSELVYGSHVKRQAALPSKQALHTYSSGLVTEIPLTHRSGMNRSSFWQSTRLEKQKGLATIMAGGDLLFKTDPYWGPGNSKQPTSQGISI